MHCIHGTGLEGGRGERGLRRRQGPGTGRLRAIAVAREAAGGMCRLWVAVGRGRTARAGGSERLLLFLLLMNSLVPGFLLSRRPRAGAVRVAGRRFVLLSAGVLRYVFPASGDRVCVCVTWEEPYRRPSSLGRSSQGTGIGTWAGSGSSYRIGGGDEPPPHCEGWVLLLAGGRGCLGVEGRNGVRLGWTSCWLFGMACREPVA